MACYNPSFVLRETNFRDGSVSARWIGSLKNCRPDDPKMVMLRQRYLGNLPEEGKYFAITELERGLEYIQVPCGKCIGCRLDYSRSWADRLTYHSFGKEDNAYFLTLTYDDDHIEDLSFSENYGLYSLNYDDMSLFIKRLRNRFKGCDIDYYYCGEYGDSEFRPHHHMILFGCFIPDLSYWKLNDTGDVIYTSDLIQDLWKRGFCTISKFNWSAAAYTAQYVLKKRDGRKLCEYEAVGLTPEKCRCSRRPGIAHDFYLEHYESIWQNDGMSVDRTVNKNGKLGIPRYFRKLAESGIGAEEYYDYKKRCLDRSNIINPLKIDNSSFDLDRIQDMLKFEEREVLSKSINKKI